MTASMRPDAQFARLEDTLRAHAPAPATIQPPALALPDGWERMVSSAHQEIYYCAETLTGPHVLADSAYVGIGDCRYTPAEARSLATRLVEAAAIVDQLRAGAR